MRKIITLLFVLLIFVGTSCKKTPAKDIGNDEDMDYVEDIDYLDESDNADNADDNDLSSDTDNTVDTEKFITVWKTDLEDAENPNQITLPLVENGTYDFIVRWGDGSEDRINGWNDPALIHTYENPGTYEVRITGIISGWQFCSGDIEKSLVCKNPHKLIKIVNWGNFSFGNTEMQFCNCLNLIITAMDVPDLSSTKSLKGAFFNNRKLSSNIKVGDLEKRDAFNKWDVSNITDMSWMFTNAVLFNAEINKWDVSNVRDISYLFALFHLWPDFHAFNQNIGEWDVSNVTNMSRMFNGSSFNRDISGWDVSNVTDMSYMFSGIDFFSFPDRYPVQKKNPFDHDIGAWNVSSVKNMKGMFYISNFNQDLSGWCVENIGEKPDTFDLYADEWELPRPVWGTCPQF